MSDLSLDVAEENKRRRRRKRNRLLGVNFGRLGLLIAFLAAWEWLPQIPAVAHLAHFLDPFFISSPSKIVQEIWYLSTGTHDVSPMWPNFRITMTSALAGSISAMVVGAALGVVLSHFRVVNELVRPFINALNAVPKVAIIPIVVIVFGASTTTDAITAFLVVFFLVFYNALAGGSTISQDILENFRIYGASSASVLWRVRLPFVAAWIFAQLPNAISYGLVGAVTAELFSGTPGFGQLLLTAVDTSNATLTFAVVVILMIVGVVLVMGAEMLRSKLMPWLTPPGPE
jgi:NitT/TauT family transport system permease protein